MANFDITAASFNPDMRQLETYDPCLASTFNLLFGQLIGNDVILKREVDFMQAGLDDPGLAVRILFVASRAMRQDLSNDIAEKVDMTSPGITLDTNAASSTVDGKLYAALTALGWASDVIE